MNRCYEKSGGCMKRPGHFEQATRLVEKYQQKAETLAAEVDPEPLRRLFYYLIDMVLERRQM